MNIIKADLYRLVRSKGFYITMGLFLALVTLQTITSTTGGIVMVNESTGRAVEETVTYTGKVAPFMMMKMADTGLYFILPLIIFICGTDFSSGTIKNVLSNGTKRTQLYLTKLTLSVIFCTIVLFINMLIPIIAGTLRHGFGGSFNMDFVGDLARPFLTQLLLCIGVTCVGVFFSYTAKRTAAITGAYLAFCMLPLMLFSILADLNDKFEPLLKYDIISNIRNAANIDTLPSEDVTRALCIGVFCILISTIGGLFFFKKSEIK